MTTLEKLLKASAVKIPKDSDEKLEARIESLKGVQYSDNNKTPKLDYGLGDLVKFTGTHEEDGTLTDSENVNIGDLVIITGFDKENSAFKIAKYDTKNKLLYKELMYADEIELVESYIKKETVEEVEEITEVKASVKKETTKPTKKTEAKKETKEKTKVNPIVEAVIEEPEAKKPAKKITPKTGKKKAVNVKEIEASEVEETLEEEIIEVELEDEFLEAKISYDDLLPKGDIHEKIRFMNSQGSSFAYELGKKLHEVNVKKLYLEKDLSSFQQYCDTIGLTYNIAIKRVQVYKAIVKLGLTKEQFEKIGYYRFREGINYLTKENLDEALAFIEKSNPSGEDFKIHLKESTIESETQKIAKISLALFNDEVEVLERAIELSIAEEPVEEALDQKRKRSIALVNICSQFLQFKNSNSTLESDLEFLNQRYGLNLTLENIKQLEELQITEKDEKALEAALV